MSYKKILVAVGCAATFFAGVAFEQTFDVLPFSQEIPAVEPGANGPNGINSGVTGPFLTKDWRQDPYAQGNAPQGGGPNADSGPGVLQASPNRPPETPRINPAPPTGKDAEEMQCSDPTEWGDGYYNINVPFTVPQGWSVWQCIVEHFPGRGEYFYDSSIDFLQARIDEDPSYTVRDIDIVPVGYQFVMGGDGAGPYPAENLTR